MRIQKLSITIAALLLPLTCAPAQSNQSDTLTITTYYPSPYGVYGTLEVKKGMAVGGGSSALVTSLKPGQLYVGHSQIFKGLSQDPPTAQSKPGQVIYNNPDKMLKFFNGTQWVNCTAPPPPPCPSGQICRPTDWISPTSCGTILTGMYTVICSVENRYPSFSARCATEYSRTCSTGSCPPGSIDTIVANYCSYPSANQVRAVAGVCGCCFNCYEYTIVHQCTK